MTLLQRGTSKGDDSSDSLKCPKCGSEMPRLFGDSRLSSIRECAKCGHVEKVKA